MLPTTRLAYLIQRYMSKCPTTDKYLKLKWNKKTISILEAPETIQQ